MRSPHASLLIALGLAASGCAPRGPGPAVVTIAQAVAEAPEPAPPDRLAGAIPAGTWSGACAGGGWGEIDVTLSFVPRGSGVIATGYLSFVGRRTEAHLEGARVGRAFELRGEMTEIGGIGTVWRIALTVAPQAREGSPLQGSLTEILDAGGSTRMCSFAWPVSQRSLPAALGRPPRVPRSS